jgi:hypothetical protein
MTRTPLLALAAALLTAAAPPGRIEISQATTCADVVDGAPVGAGDRFGADVGRVRFFAHVRNEGAVADKLYVEWRHGAERLSTREFPLPAGETTTVVAHRDIPPARTGDWKVRLLDGRGRLLQALPFHVGGAPERAASPPPEPAPPPRRPPARCRALVNLATRDGHRVAEVRVGAPAHVDAAPGLVVRDEGRAWALAVVPHERQSGSVQQRWDMLMGLELAPGAEPRPWHGYPASLTAPVGPQAGAARHHETNRLEILGITGPYVALHAALTAQPPGSRPLDNSRYVTLRAPGDGFDATQLVAERDRLAFGRQVIERARGTGGGLPDLRRSAVFVRGGRVVLATRVPTPDGPSRLERPVQAPALAAHLPGPDGAWTAPDACGAVGLAGGRLAARAGAEGLLEPAGDLRPAALLGVYWLAPDAPSPLPGLREAAATLGAR